MRPERVYVILRNGEPVGVGSTADIANNEASRRDLIDHYDLNGKSVDWQVVSYRYDGIGKGLW